MSANASFPGERPEKEMRQEISIKSSSVHNNAKLAPKFQVASTGKHQQRTYRIREQVGRRFSVISASRALAVLTTDRNCDEILIEVYARGSDTRSFRKGKVHLPEAPHHV